jgi:hypothetical protein
MGLDNTEHIARSLLTLPTAIFYMLQHPGRYGVIVKTGAYIKQMTAAQPGRRFFT